MGGPVVVFEKSQTVRAAGDDRDGAALSGEESPGTKEAKHAPTQIDALRMVPGERTQSGGDDGEAYENPRHSDHMKRLQRKQTVNSSTREDIQGRQSGIPGNLRLSGHCGGVKQDPIENDTGAGGGPAGEEGLPTVAKREYVEEHGKADGCGERQQHLRYEQEIPHAG